MTRNGDFELEDIWVWARELRDMLYREGAAGMSIFGSHGPSDWARRSRYTSAQVSRMLETEDKMALAPLLFALCMPVGRMRPLVLATVIRLLLSFEKTDSLDILGHTRWRLFYVLENHNVSHDPSLLVAVFHALEMSGDTEDLRAMHFLTLRYHTSAEQLISMAADRCVSAIHGRRDLERDRKTLLRTTDDQPDDLLRATRVLPYHEPEMLLRHARTDLSANEVVATE